METKFETRADRLTWSITLHNEGTQPLEIGDLALPLPMSRNSGKEHKPLLKHSFISGDGSFLFWMRSDSASPFLVMIPAGGTHLEYWENSREGGFRAYIHSAAAGAVAREHGTKWRQPNTSLMLAGKGQHGDEHRYEFKFRFAANYDDVRDISLMRAGLTSKSSPA